jgi:large subunit ribosomal protein L9
MKVVFLRDVPPVGKRGEVRDVANGYGRNFLLPQKLAVLATVANLEMAEAIRQREIKEQQRLAAELARVAQQIDGLQLTFKAKVAEEGHLYGSIRDSDIARELTQVAGFEIEKGKVAIEAPIRDLGSYQITVRLSNELKPEIKVDVVEEE